METGKEDAEKQARKREKKQIENFVVSLRATCTIKIGGTECGKYKNSMYRN